MAAVEQYLHGIEVIEVTDGIRPIQTVKASVIGIVGTAPDADTDVFPLNEPVLLIGDQRKAGLLGAAGTLRDAISDMYTITGATIVVVRVAEGATANETLSNVIGDPITKTGIWALLAANSKVKVKPRLLCAPGFTQTRPTNGIASITVNTGGNGYSSAILPNLYISGGGGFGAMAQPVVIAGVLQSVIVTVPGHGYASAPDVLVESATPVLTSTPGASNQGDGALTFASPAYGPGIRPGKYELVCTVAGATGTFTVTDPAGNALPNLTVGTAYNQGIKLTIADGSADFAVGDKFTVTVTFDPTFVRHWAEPTNVGKGVLTLATPAWGPGVQLGDYTLVCKSTSAGGGVFEVKDPAGVTLADATVGTPYTTQIKFTIADGTPDFAIGDKFTVRVSNTGIGYGATLTATPGLTANPVAKALEACAIRLKGVAFIDGPNTTDVAAVAYAGDFGSDRVCVLDPYPLVWNTQLSQYVARPPSPLAVAMQAKVDNDKGFWYSFSNIVLPMVGGMSRPVSWELDNPDTESNYLNRNKITPIVRVSGTTSGGFRFWGVRSTASDPLYAFLPVRRTADMIFESIAEAFVPIIDKPMTPQTLEDGVRSVRQYLRSLQSRGATLGGDAWLDRHLNTVDQMSAGKLTISFDFEPPAPIERLTFQAHRNAAYYEVLLEEVIRELSV
ncbi:MAG: phage tail sheath C-terminal domain-containing protein [Bacteroidota bacterium]